jgi:hypothetical protein
MEKKKDLVSNHHPCYDELEAKRVIIDDVRGGTSAMRAKGKTYLPQFPAELDRTYRARLETATLFNLYAKTENVMVGLVFQEEIDTSKVLIDEMLLENIDNKGNHFNVFAREIFEDSFDGASVILVDAPNAVNVQSLADEQSLGLRPYMIHYDQSDVINWEYRVNEISKKTELSMIVFKECKHEKAGRFIFEEATYYRVWFLNEMGKVQWELYKEVTNEKTKQAEYILMDGNIVEKLSAIPVAIVGCLDDEPPLLDLAFLNIKLYQKESNFDNAEWQSAVSLFYTKGYDKDEVFPISSDYHYKLPENGEIGWAQIDATGNDTKRESLKYLAEQMSLIGLSMLADKTANVDLTATEALLSNIGETAELRVRAEQLKDALELAIGFMAEYLGMGKDAGGEITLGAAWNKQPEVQGQTVEGALTKPATPPMPQDGMVN